MKEFYKDLTENLKHKIVVEYGSVAEFCRQKDINKFTLSKVFNGRMMTVGTFMSICSALGLFDFVLAPGVNSSDMLLSDYLDIRFNSIEIAFIKVLMGV